MADGSKAEEWFSKLTEDDKASWANVRKKWDEKWLKMKEEVGDTEGTNGIDPVRRGNGGEGRERWKGNH
jgi:hypothetical protein